MKIISGNPVSGSTRRGFTLVELLLAMAASIALAGTVVLLLMQTVIEQRNGLADTTVEEQAYMLEARITSCLRSMSANQGITPSYSSALHDSNGNLLGYQSIFMFYPSNGAYITASIGYDSTSGRVLYIPNIATPTIQTVWVTNGASVALTELCFSTSVNLDGSQNSSLVNVLFQMNDNGYSRHSPINNPANLYRNFSVQMRNDN